jgi:hypothetical protein
MGGEGTKKAGMWRICPAERRRGQMERETCEGTSRPGLMRAVPDLERTLLSPLGAFLLRDFADPRRVGPVPAAPSAR